MKRAMWLLAAVLAAIAVAAGGTFALFTASTSPADATYTAGTLCITNERDNGDPIPGPMFYVTAAQGQTPGGIPGDLPTGLWAPGDSHRRTLIVRNPTSCSSMGAWLTSVRANLASGDAALADKLWVEIRTDHNHAVPPGDEIVAQGWLSQFLAGNVPILFPDGHKINLGLSSYRFLHFTISMPLDTGNAYQGLGLVVDFEVNAEQMPNNP